MEQVTKKSPQLEEMERDLQMKFSSMSLDQRSRVANYLNMYNTTAWLYNEILEEDERLYVDLSMQYVMETNKLNASMENVESPEDVQQIVDDINDHE